MHAWHAPHLICGRRVSAGGQKRLNRIQAAWPPSTASMVGCLTVCPSAAQRRTVWVARGYRLHERRVAMHAGAAARRLHAAATNKARWPWKSAHLRQRQRARVPPSKQCGRARKQPPVQCACYGCGLRRGHGGPAAGAPARDEWDDTTSGGGVDVGAGIQQGHGRAAASMAAFRLGTRPRC